MLYIYICIYDFDWFFIEVSFAQFSYNENMKLIFSDSYFLIQLIVRIVSKILKILGKIRILIKTWQQLL